MLHKDTEDLLDQQFEDLVELEVQRRLAGKAGQLGRPIYPEGFFGGAGGGATSSSYGGSIKHIDIHPTRQQNEETAYRFFQWFCANAELGHKNSRLQAKALQFCNDHGIKALGEGTNEAGGALVPTEFDRFLIRLLERFGVFRANARLSVMTSDTKTTPRRTGGLTASWVGEGQQITGSNPTYDNVQLVAKKLGTLTVMSSEVNEDSALSIADQLAFEIVQILMIVNADSYEA